MYDILQDVRRQLQQRARERDTKRVRDGVQRLRREYCTRRGAWAHESTQRDIERARKRRHGLRADYGVGREELLKGMYYTRGAASTTAADEGEQHEVGAARH